MFPNLASGTLSYSPPTRSAAVPVRCGRDGSLPKKTKNPPECASWRGMAGVLGELSHNSCDYICDTKSRVVLVIVIAQRYVPCSGRRRVLRLGQVWGGGGWVDNILSFYRIPAAESPSIIDFWCVRTVVSTIFCARSSSIPAFAMFFSALSLIPSPR